jgi:hypothetical protein
MFQILLDGLSVESNKLDVPVATGRLSVEPNLYITTQRILVGVSHDSSRGPNSGRAGLEPLSSEDDTPLLVDISTFSPSTISIW